MGVNILITNSCSLNCPYCFAKEFVNDKNRNMTFSEVKKIITLLDLKTVRLCGGEPTMHPKIVGWLKKLLYKENIEEIVIFTNGLWTDALQSFIYSLEFKEAMKISFLFNIMKPEFYTNDQLIRLYKSLEIVRNFNASLGFTIYKHPFEYQHFINLAKKYNINSIRYSVSAPNISIKGIGTRQIKNYYKEISKIVYDLIFETMDFGIELNPDCGYIPLCCFSEDHLNTLTRMELSKNIIGSRCNFPMADVTLNGESWRCFGLRSFLKTNIHLYNNKNELFNYYNRMLKLLDNITLFPECKNCDNRFIGICGGGCYGLRVASFLKKNSDKDLYMIDNFDILLNSYPIFDRTKLKTWRNKENKECFYLKISECEFHEINICKDILMILNKCTGNLSVKEILTSLSVDWVSENKQKNKFLGYFKELFELDLVNFKENVVLKN